MNTIAEAYMNLGAVLATRHAKGRPFAGVKQRVKNGECLHGRSHSWRGTDTCQRCGLARGQEHADTHPQRVSNVRLNVEISLAIAKAAAERLYRQGRLP